MSDSYTFLFLLITVGVIEIVIFLLGALVLGYFTHFFLSNRNTMPPSVMEPPVLAEAAINDGEDWQAKYYEILELQEEIKHDLEEAKSNVELYEIEIEELRKELDAMERPKEPEFPAIEKQAEDYLSRLKMAQEGLKEHNRDITNLLEQIEQLKRAEQKTIDTIKANELLQARVQELQQQLINKESEEKLVQQQEMLLTEMKERLDTTYNDFNALREKQLQLESRVGQSGRTYEYEELQQSHFRLTKEFDELKLRHISMLEENQRLTRLLTDTEEKLRESNFQRQQLQKKNSFLEDLNNDIQQINEHNKKLENQLKRMSEIELLLSRAASKKTDEEEGHH
jgi:chromosome segregation ATPase